MLKNKFFVPFRVGVFFLKINVNKINDKNLTEE